jgi:KipI family sensor histidine kinase inhibitor
MRTIDLNADLGELVDGSLDAAVMPFISSANIACGAHAGSPETIRRTVRLAMEHGVAIGAHPGYADRENFGRLSVALSDADICALVSEQILLFRSIADEEGAQVGHVKLHGAFYNDLAADYGRSLLVCRAIYAIDPELRFIVFSGSETARAAEDAGLIAIHEVFADRAYTPEGKLMSRALPGAVIHDQAESMAQVEMMVLRSKVPLAGGSLLSIQADSVSVHGDNPSAVQFVANLRRFFEQQHISVESAGVRDFRFYPLGERSMLAKLPARISKTTHRKIRALSSALEGREGIRELVPCYAELKIDYDPTLVTFDELERHVESLDLRANQVDGPRLIEVPVCYDGEDLERVAIHNGISVDEVIRRHTEATCLIYMLGFSPGFAYMGGLDRALATPRLDIPRIKVPAGSVGIAGNQTGIYPVESPGGWNIIGQTSLSLFDPERKNPFLFEPGDEVRFVREARLNVKGLKVEGENVGQASCLSEFIDKPLGVGRASLRHEEGVLVRRETRPFLNKKEPYPTPLKSKNNLISRQGLDVCPTFKVIEPGMYTTVQDGGRYGYLRYGLPPGGAMDRAAFRRANALLGNDPDAAVLECTGTMPVLEFSQDAVISVVYADRETVLAIKAGESVRFEPIGNGYRAYIAFEGGLDVPEVMGSCSTYVPAKLGGYEGRVLRAGDVIGLGDGAGRMPAIQPCVPRRGVGEGLDLASASEAHIRVIPGPEADWFDCGGLNTFLTEAFTVSSKSDRAGIRLEGSPLSFRSEEQMVSSGIAMGTIQVPPSGLPIIMMADHPTTGGYPRIGNVVEEDLSRLAQMKPGDVLRFAEQLMSDG